MTRHNVCRISYNCNHSIELFIAVNSRVLQAINVEKGTPLNTKTTIDICTKSVYIDITWLLHNSIRKLKVTTKLNDLYISIH